MAWPRRRVAVAAKGFGKQPTKAKGFGAAKKPPASQSQKKNAAAAPKKSAGGGGGGAAAAGKQEMHPALLALIAETPQRRAERQALLEARAPEVVRALEEGTHCYIDGVLGEDMCAAMRAEAMRLLGDKALEEKIVDTDTRAASVVIEPELFLQAPLVTEYALDCAKVFAPLLSGKNGPLSDDASASMLACYGVDGGNFDVHIDNHGNKDRRVLTLIYYMNPGYDSERQGGRFIPWEITEDAPPKTEPPTKLTRDVIRPLEPIDPVGDRIIAFWTCELPHSVEEFKAPLGKQDGRYAITVWLTAQEGSEVFASGRHILSPTAAHDQRAVQERAPSEERR